MSDDLVRELRERHYAINARGPLTCSSCATAWPCDAIVAADEIERLRSRVNRAEFKQEQYEDRAVRMSGEMMDTVNEKIVAVARERDETRTALSLAERRAAEAEAKLERAWRCGYSEGTAAFRAWTCRDVDAACERDLSALRAEGRSEEPKS